MVDAHTDGGGIDALAATMAGTADGIAIIDGAVRFAYANRTACRILGLPEEQVPGRSFLDSFTGEERARVTDRLPLGVGDSKPPFLCALRGADGVHREIVCATFSLDMGADRRCVVILREVTGSGATTRAAAVLAQAATAPGVGTTDDLLRGIARLTVQTSRAVACGVVVVGEDRRLVGGASHGFPDNAESRRVWTGASVTLDDLPGSTELLAQRMVFLDDAPTAWAASPRIRGFAATLRTLNWQSVLCVPLAWKDDVHGVFAVYLRAGAAPPTDTEIEFFRAVAAQASIVVTNARLHVARERGRLARDLHDSVSQSLFSMTLHARAAQLAFAKGDNLADGPAARAIEQLVGLAGHALAEMRALIFELRPQALIEEGLVAALRTQAAVLSARERVSVEVHTGSTRLRLPADVEEHVYRIVLEALHNVVKHADAVSAQVSITATDAAVTVTVADNGKGFDANMSRSGHFGLSTMAQRAEIIGAGLAVRSTPGTGTTVTLTRAAPPRRGDAGSTDD